MNWITILFYNLWINSISGMLLFGIWSFLKKFWEKRGQYRLLYGCLKIVLSSFCIPFGWFCLFLYSYEWKEHVWRNCFPWTIPKMNKIVLVFAFLWIVGMLFRLYPYLKEKYRFYQMRRLSKPLIADVNEEIVKKLAEQFGVKRIPNLYLAEEISSPMVVGFWKKSIFLPKKQYSQEMRMLILSHEMMHIRQGDVVIKNIAALAEIIFWFHPVIYRLFHELDNWGEINCDLQTCSIGHELWSVHSYYEMILKEVIGGAEKENVFSSALYESGALMKWRMIKMRDYQSAKHLKKGMGVLFAAVFLISSPLVAFASGMQMGNVFQKIEDSLITETEIDYETENYTEEYAPASEEKEIPEIIDVDEKARINSLSVSMEDGETKMTSAISLEAKDQIFVSGWSKTNGAKLKIGIRSSSGSRQYVTVTGFGDHIFTVEKSGKYSVFIENVSGEILDAELTYIIRK